MLIQFLDVARTSIVSFSYQNFSIFDNSPLANMRKVFKFLDLKMQNILAAFYRARKG